MQHICLLFDSQMAQATDKHQCDIIQIDISAC